MMDAANPIAASVEEEPSISAVLPAYNAAHFLRRSRAPLLAMAQRGEILIALLFDDSAQVAFFNVAHSIALTFAALVTQVASTIIPSVVALRASRAHEKQRSVGPEDLKVRKGPR